MRGVLGFSGLQFWFFSESVFRFLCQKTLRFWYSLRFADCLFFSMWLSVFVKTTNRFSDLVFEVVFRFFLFGFWFLFNLSGTFLPHRKCSIHFFFLPFCSIRQLCIGSIMVLITGMWKFFGFNGFACGFRFFIIFLRFCGFGWFFPTVLWFLIDLNDPS